MVCNYQSLMKRGLHNSSFLVGSGVMSPTPCVWEHVSKARFNSCLGEESGRGPYQSQVGALA